MTWDKVKFAAETFQAVSTGLGILVGGAWVLVKFDVLEESAVARANLANAKLDADEKRRRVEAEQPAVEATFSESVVEARTGGDYFLQAKVSLTNRGSQPITLVLDEAPFQVSPAAFPPQAAQPAVDGNGMVRGSSPLRDVTIRPQTSAVLAFAVVVPNKGAYLMEFQAQRDGDRKGKDSTWSAHAYVLAK